MKLPQNSKDRQKVLALVAGGLVLAVYGLWAGVYNPVVKRHKETLTKIEKLKNDIADAEIQIIRMPYLTRDLILANSNLVRYSENYILHPSLGNYLIPAREAVNRYVRELNIDGLQIEEDGLKALPMPKEASQQKGAKGAAKPKTPYTMQYYSARISARVGLFDLITWIKRMEEDNPLLAISNLTITSQPKSPQKHLVGFEVHWPVWLDPDYRDVLLENAGMTADPEVVAE